MNKKQVQEAINSLSKHITEYPTNDGIDIAVLIAHIHDLEQKINRTKEYLSNLTSKSEIIPSCTRALMLLCSEINTQPRRINECSTCHLYNSETECPSDCGGNK